MPMRSNNSNANDDPDHDPYGNGDLYANCDAHKYARSANGYLYTDFNADPDPDSDRYSDFDADKYAYEYANSYSDLWRANCVFYSE